MCLTDLVQAKCNSKILTLVKENEHLRRRVAEADEQIAEMGLRLEAAYSTEESAVDQA